MLCWVVQGALGIWFLTHARLFIRSPDPLNERIEWVGALSPGTRYFLGATETAAAFGLVLPGLTGIAVELTTWAAMGVVVLMVLAIVFQARRTGEGPIIVLNVVLFLLAAFVRVDVGRSSRSGFPNPGIAT